MHVVEFIPAEWLSGPPGWPGLMVYSRPVSSNGEYARRPPVWNCCSDPYFLAQA